MRGKFVVMYSHVLPSMAHEPRRTEEKTVASRQDKVASSETGCPRMGLWLKTPELSGRPLVNKLQVEFRRWE